MTLRRSGFRIAPRLASRVLFLAAALSVPLCGCGGTAGDGTAAVTKESDSDSETAPDFTLPDLDGQEFSLASTAGQVRLIDFWATWCAPCREELPMLQRLSETYGDRGFTLVGISDEDAEVLREFLAAKGITYRNLIDPGDVSEKYLVLGLPTGFLVDQEGHIVERFVGPKPSSILERRIRELLELPPAT